MRLIVLAAALIVVPGGQIQAGLMLTADPGPVGSSANEFVFDFGTVPRSSTDQALVTFGGTKYLDLSRGDWRVSARFEPLNDSIFWQIAPFTFELLDKDNTVLASATVTSPFTIGAPPTPGGLGVYIESSNFTTPTPGAVYGIRYTGQALTPVSGSDESFSIRVKTLDDQQPIGVGGTSAVPEPASIALWGLGSLGMGMIARRRQRKQKGLAG